MPKRSGRKSAQTPAPKSERIYGSSKNKPKSAASKESASSIILSDEIIKALQKKADKFNETHPKNKVRVSTLKAVMRRGMGAYSKSHRPTITGGAPNSRTAWGYARVNKFLKKKAGQKVKAAYVQDDDLLKDGGRVFNDKELLQKWKKGESIGFTGEAHLKAKGLIPRADGTKRKSKKYLADGGLVAPNGKPSNLTPEQYKLVRTPEFKAWFGDWENDPKNASKVVDDNGEPLVVYHGTSTDFTIFKLEKPTIAAYGKGFYFTNDKNFASNYAREENSKILSLFLKIIKVFDIYEDEFPKEYEKYSEMSNNKGLSRDFTNKLISQGYDGVYAKNKYNENELVVFNPNQIKLADGTNKTFDGSNPDIRFKNGGKVQEFIRDGIVEIKMFDTTNEHSKEYGFDAQNPLFIKSIIVSKEHRGKGIGSKVFEYIVDYAEENKHDLIFGHITQNAEPSIDVIKSILNKSGFNTIKGNNDFYKIIDIKYKDGGVIVKEQKSSVIFQIKDEKKLLGEAKLTKHKNIEAAAEFYPSTRDYLQKAKYLQEHQYRACEEGWELEYIEVFPDYQNKGYGKKLLNEVKKWAKKNSVNVIFVYAQPYGEASVEHNYKGGLKYKALMSFYEKNGFERISNNELALDLQKRNKRQFEDGGEMKEIKPNNMDITCIKCGWSWDSKDSDKSDVMVCHKCGHDNSVKKDGREVGLNEGGNVETDVIKINVPTFLRALEFAKEDAQNDMQLHEVAENAIKMSQQKTIQMSDYQDLVKVSQSAKKMAEGGLVSEEIDEEPVEDLSLEDYVKNENQQIEAVLCCDMSNVSKVMLCEKKIRFAENEGNKTELDEDRHAWKYVENLWRDCQRKVMVNTYNKGGQTDDCGCGGKSYKDGGLAYGNSHDKGGMPLTVKSTGQNIEIEGGEGVVNKRSMQISKQVEFQGKKMTPCEVVSKINEMGGGVRFKCNDVKKIIAEDGNFD